MTKSYQSDVRTLSDEELKTLSIEIEEAYEREDEDGCVCFTDSEAEDRYYEMQAEAKRRWEEANPELAKQRRENAKLFYGEALKVISNNVHAAQRFDSEYDREFTGIGSKIGDTITVRKPERLLGYSS